MRWRAVRSPRCSIVTRSAVLSRAHAEIEAALPTDAPREAAALGATVLTASDSSGYIVDPDGLDLDLLKQIKEVQRGRLTRYSEVHAEAVYTPVEDYPLIDDVAGLVYLAQVASLELHTPQWRFEPPVGTAGGRGRPDRRGSHRPSLPPIAQGRRG